MSKDNLKFIKYLSLIVIAVVMSYKLPHDSYSFIEYVIKPIKIQNGVLYLSMLIPLILVVIGIKGFWGLERFANTNKLISILFVVVILIPFTNWTIDFARTNYHSIKNDGISSLDIKESNISLGNSGESVILNVNVSIKNYSRALQEFRIRVHLPKSLRAFSGTESYDLGETYIVPNNNSLLNIQKEIVIEAANIDQVNDLLDTYWHYEDVTYEFYDANESVTILKHGY